MGKAVEPYGSDEMSELKQLKSKTARKLLFALKRQQESETSVEERMERDAEESKNLIGDLMEQVGNQRALLYELLHGKAGPQSAAQAATLAASERLSAASALGRRPPGAGEGAPPAEQLPPPATPPPAKPPPGSPPVPTSQKKGSPKKGFLG